MAVHVHTTLSFDLKPFKNFKEVLDHAITLSGKSNKEIAIALGMKDNQLSMMLKEYEGKRHFPVHRLPDLIRELGDPGKLVVQWLVNEFLLTKAERISQAEDVLARYADVLPLIQNSMAVLVEAGREKP